MDAKDYLDTFLDALMDYLYLGNQELAVPLIAAIRHARWVADSRKEEGGGNEATG